MKQQFIYDKETKLNAVGIIQRHILQEQLDKLQSLVINGSATPLPEKSISSLLIQRAERDKKLLDDFEMAILVFLDSDGKISSVVRLQDFMYLMTRISKIDQRALCLHILNDRLDDTCCKAFVDLGGFRLLKRWIRIAADENCADELNLIVNICKKLPFDEVIVRETEIGKSIKKLLKFRDDKDGSDSLKVSAQSLIELWTEEMKTIRAKTDNPKLAAEKTIVELPDDAIDLLELVNERMFTHRKLIPKLSHVPSPIVVAKEVASSAVDRSDSLILKDPLQIDVDSESTPSSARSSSDNITPTGGATLRTSFSGPSPGLSTLREKIKQEKEGKQKAGTDILALLQNKRKVSLVDPDAMDLSSTTDLSPLATLDLTDSDSTSSRRAMDASRGMELMADKAMKLLAARELAEKMRTIEDKMQVDDIDYAQIAKPKVNVVLKSCLKQKNNNIAKVETDSVLTPATAPVTAPVVKEKQSLKWADDSGGELREVRTFEVKNLKKSTASYKSHRDLVKKEKMLEKSSNISKIVEAMQPTTKWTTPKPRILSFEMQENACGPIESSDSEIQASRIAHILEARYMDDSLIPAEPDEAPSAREIATSTEGVKEIPWFISDNVFDQDDTDRIIHGYRHLQYNPSFDSSQDSAHQEGAWGLPPVLQGLEREVLNALMQDESKILSILNDDGTINEWKLDQLRRDLHLPPRGFRPSGDEFRGGFLPNPGMYNDNHYGYGDEDRYSGQFSPDIEPPSFGHNMQRNESFPRARVSRWSAPASETSHDLLASSNDIYGLWENEGVIPWQREGRGAQFREASVPTIDKYGPGGGGSGGSGFLREDRNRFSADDDAGRKRVRPQKTNTPCKFFNTPKGCQFGSKCAFGHYAESSAPERAPVQGSLGGVPKRSRFSPPATMTDSFAL